MIERLIVCMVGPLPLKCARAQAQFDFVVVIGCTLEAIYRQLECVHDVGFNEMRAVEGGKRGAAGCEENDVVECIGPVRGKLQLGRSGKPRLCEKQIILFAIQFNSIAIEDNNVVISQVYTQGCKLWFHTCRQMDKINTCTHTHTHRNMCTYTCSSLCEGEQAEKEGRGKGCSS